MATARYEIWHHWTIDPEREAIPERRDVFSHGYWILKFEREALIGAALWRRRLAWTKSQPGLTVHEAVQEYGYPMGRPAGHMPGPRSVDLRDLPNLTYDSDPEVLQALRVTRARQQVDDNLESVTETSLVDLLGSPATESYDDLLTAIGRSEEYVGEFLSYDGWSLEYVFDDELIAHASRGPLARLRDWLLRTT